MSGKIDLSASVEAAKAAVDGESRRYMRAQEELESASAALTAAQQKLRRLEKALAILNGEEEPAPTPAPAVVDRAAVPAPPPPPRKAQPEGPYARVRCGGCQSYGSMAETLKPTKSGTTVRLLVCGECGNEVYLG